MNQSSDQRPKDRAARSARREDAGPLRVLHVGVANRGTWPLRWCRPERGYVPTALCDVAEPALEKARGLTGLPVSACYTQYDRALAEADVDCVVICTPTVHHLPMTAKALQAGLPVLVEKGMAPDWTSACKMAVVAAETGVPACVAQNYRFKPMEMAFRRAIHDPDHPTYVGEVHAVLYTQNRVRPNPRTLNYPFASVWDMSCHHFDTLMHWFGPIQRMTGFAWGARWSAYEHPNNTAAHIQFARGGLRCHYLHQHDAARASLEVELHGERGALVLRDDQLTFNDRPLEQFGVRPTQHVPLGEGEGEAGVLDAFHRYVTAGEEPGISVRNNLETMAACEMFVRSVQSGQTAVREALNGYS